MPYNGNIKWEILAKKKRLVCNLAILHMIPAEVEFSCHPLRLTNYTPPCFRLRSRNQTTRAQYEAEGEESNLAQKTAILRPLQR